MTFRNVSSLLIFCGNLLAIYFKTFPVDWAASRDSQVTFTQSRVSLSLNPCNIYTVVLLISEYLLPAPNPSIPAILSKIVAALIPRI